jgi:integrase
MPRKVTNALTRLQVEHAKPGRHVDGHGLQLLVKPSGARSWVLRYFTGGKAREIGLGPADGKDMVPLAKAREHAAALRSEVRTGLDPLAERQKQTLQTLAKAQAAKIAQVTFKASAESYLDAQESGWRNDKHRLQWHSTLAKHAYPIIGDIPVAEIDTPHILSVLRPIWTVTPETASRLRGRIERILDAARVEGHRGGDNPARWKGHLAPLLLAPTKARAAKRRNTGKGEHHAALPYRELPAFMADLRRREGVAALALEFAILTAARTGEVIGATWDEFDTERGLWTIPASRMKADKEHRVPLTARALEILEQVRPLGGEHVFASSKQRSLLRRIGTPATVHGFRSTFRDWCAEKMPSVPAMVAEMCLAHSVGSKVEQAYLRTGLLEQRSALLGAWERYCLGGAGTVIRLAASNG